MLLSGRGGPTCQECMQPRPLLRWLAHQDLARDTTGVFCFGARTPNRVSLLQCNADVQNRLAA